MVPLYLPLTLDEPDQSAGTPIFFSGINVYLDQKFALFRKAPQWVHKLFSSARLLKWAAGRAAKTRAEEVGELTLSMLRGEEGNQARELEDLIVWLKTQPKADVICLSNALLIGLVRKLKQELSVPIACMLQGEDSFLDSLPMSVRDLAWHTLAERCADVDLFLAPTSYYGGLMGKRLGLHAERVRLVPNGINLQGYKVARVAPDPPVLGYFARMCREKGLHTLVDAYLLLREREDAKNLRLHVGGGCGPNDESFVNQLSDKLSAAGALEQVQFFPNVDRAQKLAFYQGLSIFSTPALYGESFGLYVLEAGAAGVPVVQPRHAAFPELVEAIGGGVLCEPGDPKALADAIENLLRQPLHARQIGQRGREAVLRDYSIERMADNVVRAFAALAPGGDEVSERKGQG
jgi:glycosyltransferase involved in cell wall biosynthesis